MDLRTTDLTVTLGASVQSNNGNGGQPQQQRQRADDDSDGDERSSGRPYGRWGGGLLDEWP